MCVEMGNKELFIDSHGSFFQPLPIKLQNFSTHLETQFDSVFIYLFIFVCAGSSLLHGLSLVVESGSYSLAVVRGLLIKVASPVEHGLQGMQDSVVVAPRLQSIGLIVVTHGLTCSTTCEILPDQGLNPCFLHYQVDSLPLSHQGNSESFLTLKQYYNFSISKQETCQLSFNFYLILKFRLS